MSNERDGTDRSDGIDTIRELLRKLEEVAATSGAESALRDTPAPQVEATVAPPPTVLTDATISAETLASDAPAPQDDKTLSAAPSPLDVAMAGPVVTELTALTERDASPLPALATLRREGAVARPKSEQLPEILLRPVEPAAIRQIEHTPLASPSPARGRGRGIALAAGSFVLGVAAAAAIIVTVDPFKRATPPPRVAEAPTAPAAVPAPTPVADTASASAVAIVASANVVTQAAPVAAEPAPPTTSAAALEPPEQPPERTSEQPSEPMHAMLPPVPPPSPLPGAIISGAPAALPSAKPASSAAASAVAAVGTPALQRPAATSQTAPAPSAPELSAVDRIDLRPGERRPLGIRLKATANDTSASLVVLRNVPEWLSLSKGSTIGNGIWLLPAHEAGDLAAELAGKAEGSTSIAVQLARLDGRILAETTTVVHAERRAEPSALIAAVPEAGQQSILLMQTRGELLLDTGEVEAARTLFRTAAEAGSVSAALRLAETYDPGEVRKLGVADTSADHALAVKWYEHAEALGSPLARSRLANLGRR